MRDYCDGTLFRSHPLFTSNPNSLQIILYYDDVEICNPLGSKAKVHKLGMNILCTRTYHLYCYMYCILDTNVDILFNTGIFYYMLGNLRPMFRSSLKSIQLLCIVKAGFIQKYGSNCVLQPFMNDIALLEKVLSQTCRYCLFTCILLQDEGVEFIIGGQVKRFRGTLVLATADNLASQMIGGYKGLASALRKCRFCLTVNEDMTSKVNNKMNLPIYNLYSLEQMTFRLVLERAT